MKWYQGRTRGVRIQALIGWLGNYAHVPYAKIRELLFELGQIDIGEGTLVATNQTIAQAIETPVEQLANWVKIEQPNVHVDETPWSVKGVKEWLWVVANQAFCLFRAADTRSRAELESLLGSDEYRGVLCSDEWARLQRIPCGCTTEVPRAYATAFSTFDQVSRPRSCRHWWSVRRFNWWCIR